MAKKKSAKKGKVRNNPLFDGIKDFPISNLVAKQSMTGKDSRRIAVGFASCLVPIQKGIMGVPSQIVEMLNRVAANTEEMAEPAVLDVRGKIQAFEANMAVANLPVAQNREGIVAMYTCAGVKDSRELARKLLKSIRNTANALLSVSAPFLDDDAFFANQNLGLKTVTFDPAIIMPEVEDFGVSMNRLVAGERWCKLLAIISVANDIAQMLADKKIMSMLSMKSELQMLNEFGVKTDSRETGLHVNMCNFVNQLIKIEARKGFKQKKKGNEEAGQLLTTAKLIVEGGIDELIEIR